MGLQICLHLREEKGQPWRADNRHSASGKDRILAIIIIKSCCHRILRQSWTFQFDQHQSCSLRPQAEDERFHKLLLVYFPELEAWLALTAYIISAPIDILGQWSMIIERENHMFSINERAQATKQSPQDDWSCWMLAKSNHEPTSLSIHSFAMQAQILKIQLNAGDQFGAEDDAEEDAHT